MENFTIDELDALYARRKEVVETEYADLKKLCEKGVSENFALLRTIEIEYAKQVQKSGTPLNGPNALTPILYRKACHYLYSALHLVRYGHIDASYSCIRTATEHLWRMYFLILSNPDEKLLLFKSEMNENIVGAPSQDDQLTHKELKTIEDNFQHFSSSFMRRYLYSKNKREIMRKLYHQFSLNSHPSIVGMAAETEFKKASVEDLLKVFPHISTGLIAVGLEIYPEDISDETDKRIHLFLDEVGEKIGFLSDFFPDNNDFEKRLRIKKNRENSTFKKVFK